MTSPGSRGGFGVFVTLLGLLFKLALTFLLIAAPLLGVWVASSLAAYGRFPVWVPLLVGALLFPVGPGLWELRAWYKRRAAALRAPRGLPPAAPILRTFDRFILRTLLLNGALLGLLLWSRPELAFVALSTRGDWMLDGRSGPGIEATRGVLFSAAQQLEWLYKLAHNNPFRDPTPNPGGTPTGTGTTAPTSTGAGTGTTGTGTPGKGAAGTGTAGTTATGTGTTGTGTAPTAGAGTTPAPTSTGPGSDGVTPTPALGAAAWPVEGGLHPLVAAMPADIEGNIAAMGAHLRRRIDDPLERIRAVHDYVADRIAYDAVAYAEGRYPPQDAATVLRTRKGVCAGYAQLFQALGQAAGLDVVYVVGVTRTQDGTIAGQGHAWNAARAGQRWYLIDTTWDSGTVQGKEFTKNFRTSYLMTPPEYFGYTHLPEDPRWQLRERPLARGEFLRQPMLTPSFFAEGLTLVTPDRSQIDVQGALTMKLQNKKGRFLLASYAPLGDASSKGERCEVKGTDAVDIRCTFAAPGAYNINLFAGPQPYGTFAYVGKIQVNAR
jgi:hypothetical protein